MLLYCVLIEDVFWSARLPPRGQLQQESERGLLEKYLTFLFCENLADFNEAHTRGDLEPSYAFMNFFLPVNSVS